MKHPSSDEAVRNGSSGFVRTTLLEVVTAVAEVSNTEGEVVAVLHHLFSTGRMRLIGEFTEKDFAALTS